MKLSRRLFLKRSGLTGGALAASVSGISPALAKFAPGPAAAVVTYFDGHLWLDTTGLSRPYRAPAGARAAAPAADLTDAELQVLYGRI
jgi:hypothetical protein